MSIEDEVTVKEAELGDLETVFHWRNMDEIVALSQLQKTVSWEEHSEWFRNSIVSSDHAIYIIIFRGQEVGLCRFERLNRVCELSIYLTPGFTNKGIGKVALIKCISIEHENCSLFRAQVRPENTASCRFFENIGFVRKAITKAIVKYEMDTSSLLMQAGNHKTNFDMAVHDDDDRNISLYTKLLEKHGDGYESLNWGSRDSQNLRFKILSEVGIQPGDSVLDVGCGLADLYSWFSENNIDVNYTGLDLTPGMISRASELFPDVAFILGNVKDFKADQSCTFDFVLASGIFAHRQQYPIEYFQETIRHMYRIARKAVCFNCLSSWRVDKDAGEFYADPGATLAFCHTVSERLVIRHDYHRGDFTIYLYKNETLSPSEGHC